MDAKRLGKAQANIGGDGIDRGRPPALGRRLVPEDRQRVAERGGEALLLRRRERRRSVGAPVDRADRNERQERIGNEIEVAGQMNTDPPGPVALPEIGPVEPSLAGGGGDPHRLQQDAGGQQRRLAAAIVEEIARAADMDHDMVGPLYLEPPGLRVVAARRPARLVDDEVEIARRLRGVRRGVAAEAFAQAIGERELHPLQRVGIAARQPAADPTSAIGVELVVPGRGAHFAAAEQDLQDLGGGNPGTELAGQAERGTALAVEVDAREIHEIAALKAARHETEGEIDALPLGRQAGEPEILLEIHPSRHEDEIARAHADRRGGDRRNAERVALGEDLRAQVELEEIERIDIDVDAGEEGVEAALVDALRKDLEIQRRIDVARHRRQGRSLGPAERGHRRAGLTIEVGELETVEIGDMEAADAEPRQGQEMRAADAAEPGDRYPLAAQDLLLGRRDPTEVAAEGFLVVEFRCRLLPRNFEVDGAARVHRSVPRGALRLRRMLRDLRPEHEGVDA